MAGKGIGQLRLANEAADYKKLGIDPVNVAAFEDGQRIGTERGCYEWWYFDAHLDNGSTIVIVFYTKPSISPEGLLAPCVSINITLADGRVYEKIYNAHPENFSASKNGCDVTIGENHFIGDLHHYRITAAIDNVSVDVDLSSEVRPWRPKSGHMYFTKDGKENLFAWLPSVPQGVAKVTYKIDQKEFYATGSGYHDHNWGDIPMQSLMQDWYWARAQAGPYTVIASYITAAEAYGYDTQIIYMLARDGKIISDDDSKVTFVASQVATDSKTGKPVADLTQYFYVDGNARYVVSFEREKTIWQAPFVDYLPFWKRLAAKLVGFDGAYHRFTGKVVVEKFENDVSVERFEAPAIWELMYFGKARVVW